jgi:HSP20 family protein
VVTYRSPWDRLDSLREGFDRLFDELSGRTAPAARPRAAADDEPQTVPINVFETDSDVVVVAAMPGIEAENIDIRVDNGYLTISAEKRGPGQEHHKYLRREWSYGPYERSIEVPAEVDGDRANATYGNGIVTIALPKSPKRQARKIEIRQDGTK